MKVNLIVLLLDVSRGIGVNGTQPYFIKKDMENFRDLTLSHPVAMGRKTWEDIFRKIKKPLPNRHNIVISRNKDYIVPAGVSLVSSYEEALEIVRDQKQELFVIGGGMLYQEALHHPNEIECIYITRIRNSFIACDTFFPVFEDKFFLEKSTEWEKDDENKLIEFRFEEWIPKTA